MPAGITSSGVTLQVLFFAGQQMSGGLVLQAGPHV